MHVATSSGASFHAGARALGRTAAFSVYMLGTLLTVEITERVARDRNASLHEIKRRFCRDLLRLFGIATHIVECSPQNANRARLIVANHRLVVDIPVLLGHFGGRVLSRADVAQWPLLGLAARKGNTIFVDRADEHSGASAIRVIRRCLKAGDTVIVFPEGGTFPGDEVREFHAGVFSAARGLDADIVPVGLAYPLGTEYVGVSFAKHLAALSLRKRTTCVMAVGESFPASKDTREMTEHAQTAVQELVEAARARFQECE